MQIEIGLHSIQNRNNYQIYNVIMDVAAFFLLKASNQLPGGGMTSATENMQLAMNLIRATNAKRALDVGNCTSTTFIK